jgi:hypothetical protein
MHMGKKKMVAEATPEAEITATEIPGEAPVQTATEEPAPEVKKPKRVGKKKATPDGARTLADLSEKYLTHLAEGEWSGGTISSYSMELRTAQIELGAETLVSDLTPEKVQGYFESKRVTKLRSGKAKAKPSVDKTRRVLRLALVWAVEAGLIEKAPLPEVPANA